MYLLSAWLHCLLEKVVDYEWTYSHFELGLEFSGAPISLRQNDLSSELE